MQARHGVWTIALALVPHGSSAAQTGDEAQRAFRTLVGDVTAVARRLIDSLATNAPPQNREAEARKAHERALKRFG